MFVLNRIITAAIAILFLSNSMMAQTHPALGNGVRSLADDERLTLFSFPPSAYSEFLSEHEAGRLDHILKSALVSYRMSSATQGAILPVQLRHEEQLPAGISRVPSGELIYSVILHTDNPLAVRAAGIEVNTVMPGFVTARIREHQLGLLPNIEAVSAAESGDILYPAMDQSLYDTGAHLLHSGQLNGTQYAGEGAFLVVFDTGVDWLHTNFRHPDDRFRSRIEYLWDVTLNAQDGEFTPGGDLDYGVEYTRENIEAAFSNPSLVRSRDTNGHGTHVLGSAAASGAYAGIAPDASIIVIRGGVSSFSIANIINGLEYARSKGEIHNKPVVVNLSIGGRVGPRDGTRVDEQAIDALSANPGYIVVTSAGNDGGRNLHRSGIFGSSENATLVFNVPEFTPTNGTGNDQYAVDIWIDSSQPVNARIISPNNLIYDSPESTDMTFPDNTDGTVYRSNTVAGNRRNIFIRVYDSEAGSEPAVGNWVVELSGDGADIPYNAWLTSFTVGNDVVSFQSANNDFTVTMPATSERAITVGAYTVNRNFINSTGTSLSFLGAVDGDIASFSSRGPTRDGRLKPDISAPGFGIKASLSRDENVSNASSVLFGNRHIIKSGTSMASPHVSGAVTVLLGADPGLTSEEAKNLLIQTANRDTFTGNIHDNTWGAGKLNLLEAMRELLNLNTHVATETIQYHSTMASPSDMHMTAESGMRYAVRFLPGLTGDLTGFHLHTFNENSTVGRLFFEVYTDNNGEPGIQTGQRVEVDLADIRPSYYNYFNLSSSGVKVESATEYHIVFGTEDGGVLNFVIDNGSGNSERSKMFENGNWNHVTTAGGSLVREIASKIEITSGLMDASAVPIPDDYELPLAVELNQNYPNPFNPVTNITFSVPFYTDVNLSVYDVLGRRVAQLVDGSRPQGTYTIQWDAGSAASGVYIYRFEAAGEVFTRKMTLVK